MKARIAQPANTPQANPRFTPFEQALRATEKSSSSMHAEVGVLAPVFSDLLSLIQTREEAFQFSAVLLAQPALRFRQHFFDPRL